MDPIGVSTFRMREIALGVGASCTPGPSVFMPGYGRDPGPRAIQPHHRIDQVFDDLS